MVAADDLDLIEVLPRQVTWHNVYDDGEIGQGHSSRAEADNYARTSCARVAVYRIERDEDGKNPTLAEEAV